MFDRYRAYLDYQKAVYAWAESVGYESKDVAVVYPWSTTQKPTRSIVVYLQVQPIELPAEYHRIYFDQNIAIYERLLPETPRALRHGVPEPLQRALLAQARAVIEMKVQGYTDIEIPDYHEYLAQAEEVCAIDVSIWMGGVTRGSYVFTETAMGAVVRAASRVADDVRFKLLQLSELAQMRVEVLVMPALVMPRTSLDTVLPVAAATTLEHKNEAKSWFVAAVANTSYFPSLFSYEDKLRLKARINPVTESCTFIRRPSFAFVESGQSSLPLFGVIPQRDQGLRLDQETCIRLGQNLVKSVDSDGHTPVVFPADGSYQPYSFDAVRLAFLEYTLREYALLSSDQQFEPTRERIWQHLRTQPVLAKHQHMNIYNALSATLSGTQSEAVPYVATIPYRAAGTDANTDVILYIQMLKVHALQNYQSDSRGVPLVDAVKAVYDVWSSSTGSAGSVNAIIYADLLLLLNHFNLEAERREFISWLEDLSEQNQTPATCFSIRTTRGVGKLAESLAATEDTHQLAHQALTWLSTMWYTDETMYHIPAPLHDRFRYGFRHDYWNRDVWLDGTCHVLLAISRLLYFDTYTKLPQTSPQ